MSHTVIIMESVTPPTPGGTADAEELPAFCVEVTYRPDDSHTPAQIGNEVARIQRRVNQIIEGSVD